MAVGEVLQSWHDGLIKSSIVEFVARVTNRGSTDYVPPAERIAVFDNDGTLWCEQPMQVQVFFALDRIKHLAKRDPTLAERQPFKAFIERDFKTIASLGKRGAFEFAFMTHAGVSEEEFDALAHAWLEAERHPTLGRLFKRCVFRPQIELLDYLRDNGFRTFIVSGGGIDLMRAMSEEAYSIPREQVIGSSLKTRVDVQAGVLTLFKLSELGTFDDREVKVENIGLHIGRRPILAFGNSDGDLAMMRYTLAGPRARLALLLHHDDAEREFAYDREFRLSPLSEALDCAEKDGIRVVSMKRDWCTVFI
ncbi:HAD family hydrolase [Steroidobacter cummioxidans]|uniref:HAD family hydrolase n=1 Tax=Steroidobacter cummioxidans TaxID=1803913 RepID=UPI000E324829|nr:HAD family hydrolase [Steroidobacter cummioxidans]